MEKAAKPTRPAGVRMVEIDARHAGQRIDNFLLATLRGVPRSHVYRLLRRGEVRVNKGRIKPVYRLRAGDVVRIPPVQTATSAPPARPHGELVARLEQAVLFEDDHLLVLDKPGGLAVHGGSGIRVGLIEILRQLRPHAGDLALVHRLDRETSGCLLVAKARPVLLDLQAQFKGEGVGKHYLTLLKGQWLRGEQVVELPLHRDRLQSGERMVTVDETGRAAVSVFTPRTLYREASLMEVSLRTGRMHQIRVHAAWLGHPVAGDRKYGAPDFNRAMRRLGLRRLFLHAARLEFRHPVSGERLCVEAPLSGDLAGVLRRLDEE